MGFIGPWLIAASYTACTCNASQPLENRFVTLGAGPGNGSRMVFSISTQEMRHRIVGRCDCFAACSLLELPLSPGFYYVSQSPLSSVPRTSAIAPLSYEDSRRIRSWVFRELRWHTRLLTTAFLQVPGKSKAVVSSGLACRYHQGPRAKCCLVCLNIETVIIEL